jgi:hypothetical protein
MGLAVSVLPAPGSSIRSVAFAGWLAPFVRFQTSTRMAMAGLPDLPNLT